MKNLKPLPYTGLITAASIFAAIVIIAYFYKFGGGLSENQSDWGAFGSIVAGVAGLLAFAGALYTLSYNIEIAKKTDERALQSEERNIFFRSLELYEKAIENLNLENKSGRKALKLLWEKAPQFITAYIIFDLLYKDKYKDFESELTDELKKEFKKNFKPVKVILDSATSDNIIPNETFSVQDREKAIAGGVEDDDLFLKIKNIAEFIGKDYDQYRRRWSFIYIKHYASKGDSKMLYELYSKSYYCFFRSYDSYLAVLSRNIHYTLKMVDGFKATSPENHKDYMELFRAQFTRQELLLIYLNHFSRYTSLLTMDLYNEADIFNNLNREDLWLHVVDDAKFKSITKEMGAFNKQYLLSIERYGTEDVQKREELKSKIVN